MAVARKRNYTVAEYFELDGASDQRHEFVDGEIFAMSGGTANHNRITVDLGLALGNALRTGNAPCEVFSTDMRLYIQKANAYTYPDVMLVCGHIEFQPGRRDVLTNPTILFEVLSDSTSSYDHTRKFALYRQLPSLREYVMLDQDRDSVECFRRAESNLWVFQAYESLTDNLELPTAALEIPVSTIYARVVLET